MFIVLEGLDRSGKTTQVQALVDYFNNVEKKPTIQWQYPDRSTVIGKLINQFLQGDVKMDARSIFLLFSANRWELQEKLEDILESGTNVICDRYTHSGIAYGYANGLPLPWCFSVDDGLIVPDLVMFMDADPEQLRKRSEFGSEVFEQTAFQKKVNEMYMMFVNNKHNWIKIDASKPREMVTLDIIHNIKSHSLIL